MRNMEKGLGGKDGVRKHDKQIENTPFIKKIWNLNRKQGVEIKKQGTIKVS